MRYYITGLSITGCFIVHLIFAISANHCVQKWNQPIVPAANSTPVRPGEEKEFYTQEDFDKENRRIQEKIDRFSAGDKDAVLTDMSGCSSAITYDLYLPLLLFLVFILIASLMSPPNILWPLFMLSGYVIGYGINIFSISDAPAIIGLIIASLIIGFKNKAN